MTDIALDVFIVADDGTLVPLRHGAQIPGDVTPPEPPYDVFISGDVELDLDDFGVDVSPAGRPYNDTAGAGGEAATFDVDPPLNRPYLED